MVKAICASNSIPKPGNGTTFGIEYFFDRRNSTPNHLTVKANSMEDALNQLFNAKPQDGIESASVIHVISPRDDEKTHRLISYELGFYNIQNYRCYKFKDT